MSWCTAGARRGLFGVCLLAVDEVYVAGVDALDEAVCLVEVCVCREQGGGDRGLELALVHDRDLSGVLLLDVRTESALSAVAGDEDCVLRSSSHQCSKILRDMPFWSMPGPAMTTQGFVVAVRSKILLEKWGNDSNGFAVASFDAVVHEADAALVLAYHTAAEPEKGTSASSECCCVQCSTEKCPQTKNANMGMRYLPLPTCRCSCGQR